MEKYFLINISKENILIPFHSVDRIVEEQVESGSGTTYQCKIHQSEFDEPLYFQGSMSDLLKKVNLF